MEALRGADSHQRRFKVQRRARLAYSDGARRSFAAGYSFLGLLAAIASRSTTVAASFDSPVPERFSRLPLMA
jgi:hypothetical protein